MNRYTLRLLVTLSMVGPIWAGVKMPAVVALTQSQACTTKQVSAPTIAVAPTGEKVYRASSHPLASADGNLIAYESSATLENEDNPWFNSLIMIAEQSTGNRERLDVNTAGQAANDSSQLADMTLDGRYVAFTSYATNLVAGAPQGSLYIRDRLRRVTELVSIPASLRQGLLANPLVSLSADARYVAFGNLDLANVYVYDRVSKATEQVNFESGNASRYSLAPDISADGRYIAFTSGLFGKASNNVFVYDRSTGITELVSSGVNGQPAEGINPKISTDGRYVVFVSSASNLVAGDTNKLEDVFVRDLQQKVTQRVSVSTTGQQANGASFAPAIAPKGQYVTFSSTASNLVAGDTNKLEDVFVRDLRQQVTQRVNVSDTNTQANNTSYQPSVSTGSRTVAFTTDATNLVAEDTNGLSDVFVRTCGSSEL